MDGCYWHLVGRGQGCYWTPYNAKASPLHPTRRYSGENVNSAAVAEGPVAEPRSSPEGPTVSLPPTNLLERHNLRPSSARPYGIDLYFNKYPDDSYARLEEHHWCLGYIPRSSDSRGLGLWSGLWNCFKAPKVMLMCSQIWELLLYTIIKVSSTPVLHTLHDEKYLTHQQRDQCIFS